MDSFLGEWKLASSENFDEVMKELGVGLIMRKLGNTVKPNIRFERDANGVWKMTTISTVKTQSISFELGKEFDEETLDGRKVKSVVSVDGENDKKLTHTQRDSNGNVVCVITREINDKNDYVTTIKVGDVQSVRVYKKN